MFEKSHHPAVSLYLSMVPTGTYSVALSKVLVLKQGFVEAIPSITNGSLINDTTSFKLSQPENALSPMLVTLPGMITEVKPLQS